MGEGQRQLCWTISQGNLLLCKELEYQKRNCDLTELQHLLKLLCLFLRLGIRKCDLSTMSQSQNILGDHLYNTRGPLNLLSLVQGPGNLTEHQ